MYRNPFPNDACFKSGKCRTHQAVFSAADPTCPTPILPRPRRPAYLRYALNSVSGRYAFQMRVGNGRPLKPFGYRTSEAALRATWWVRPPEFRNNAVWLFLFSFFRRVGGILKLYDWIYPLNNGTEETEVCLCLWERLVWSDSTNENLLCSCFLFCSVFWLLKNGARFFYKEDGGTVLFLMRVKNEITDTARTI